MRYASSLHVLPVERISVDVPTERESVVPSMPFKDRCFSFSKRGLVALCDSNDIKMLFT